MEWGALEEIIKELNFPVKFVRWTMVYVSTVSYRYVVNGSPSECLKSRNGLRQGDPTSPLLFVFIIEYLHRCLKKLQRKPNIYFGDDLMLFCRGDPISVQVMMDIFEDFSKTTGLKSSPTKCKVYYGGLKDEVKAHIMIKTGSATWDIHFKYLEVLLSNMKLSIHQCNPLVDSILARIQHWTSRLLSYVGRL